MWSRPQALDSCRRTCGHCVWTRRPHCQILSPGEVEVRINRACLENWLPSKVKGLTYFKNTYMALCLCGLTVASNRGRNMFSRILAKCGINFFDLKMSLHDQRTKKCCTEACCLSSPDFSVSQFFFI